ncbi:MAG: hypothetical protein ABSC19_11165 [Syntrophorhabdales bacterium]
MAKKATRYKRLLILVFLLCTLVSCGTGPIFIAKNENEGIKGSYQDPQLSELSARYQQNLKGIYKRYRSAGIDVYPNGIGFTAISDNEGRKHCYLLVQVRPRDISFGEAESKPKERFSEVFNHHFEDNLRYLKATDLDMEGVDGLAFGVFWPVRDYSRCNQYGGFLEYTLIYFHKEDFIDLTQKTMTLPEAVNNAEVVISLNRKPPRTVKVTEVE